MASTIKLKNGSGAPLAGDLVQGEPALDLTNKRLYTEDSGGTVIEVGTNPSTIDINAGTIDGTVIGGSSAAAITGTTITGTSFVSSGNMTFGDSDKAIFGAGSDLQIYHDGSNSYVQDAGDGALILNTTNGGGVYVYSAGETMATFNSNGAVNLYYDNAAKLATTATGIDVTGTAVVDGLTSSAAITSTSNSNSLGGTTFTSAISGTTANMSGSITVSGNSNTIGGTSFSAGVDVTGTVTADGLTVDGEVDVNSGDISLSAGKALKYSATSYITPENNVSGAEISTAGSFNVKTGSTPLNRFKIDGSTGDLSLFEDTGTTAKFFWDASAERLGVRTSSPTAPIAIIADGTNIRMQGEASDTNGCFLDWYKSAGTRRGFLGHTSSGADLLLSNDENGAMAFRTNSTERLRIDSSGNLLVGTTSSTNAGTVRIQGAASSGGDSTVLTLHQDNYNVGGASLIKIATEANNFAKSAIGFKRTEGYDRGAIIFCQENTGDASDVDSSDEVMRIDSSGNLLVSTTNTTTSTTGFKWRADLDRLITVADGGSSASFGRLTSDGDVVVFQKDGTTVGSIGTEVSDGTTPADLVITAGTINGARLWLKGGDSGLILDGHTNSVLPTDENSYEDNRTNLGSTSYRFKDLYLSGGVYLGGTGAANKLDDYEEGTFTPYLESNGQVGSFTYTAQAGFYRKIGNLVVVHIEVSWSALPTTGATWRVAGLPFPYTSSSSADTAGASIASYSGIPNTNGLTGRIATTGGGTRTAVKWFSDGATGINVTTGNNISSSGSIRFSLSYLN